MSVDTDHNPTVKKRSGISPLRSFFAPILRPMRRMFGHLFFSSITRRILILNLAALVLLMSGILYLNQFRDGLIDARVESLMTQGEIISGAIAASASVETNAILIDPEMLLELEAGESIVPKVDGLDNLDFPINPERVAPVLRRLISPTRTRARIYDRDANLILDSRHLYSRGQILRYELDPIDAPELSILDRVKNYFGGFFVRRYLPVYREQPGGTGALYPEVMGALSGGRSQIVRVSEQGEMIVSVAVPVQRFRAVLGVLQLSTQGGDIDKIVTAEREAMYRVFAVAVMVNVILSMLLASTIANPLRRLSAGAVRVRKSIKAREEIPDFSDRQDEIGNLSVALRDMTQSLYGRIDAIESFAADVSHELKNPLTSLRSAVETLPMVKKDEMRNRLLGVIEHDVRRLDRLITDISNASRLDAELVREDAQPVDLETLLKNMVSIFNQGHLGELNVELNITKLPAGTSSYTVPGNESRLGQVVTNLIENARSFIPKKGGEVKVYLAHKKDHIEVRVEDNGPGIRAENTETIFKRFYTDRPGAEEFGKNSGLGLSISRQIVEAHGGTLIAENIESKTDIDEFGGARFILCLPCE
ncbi:sensor histidine kinase [Ahrensia sp. 13_GOM-1096m]|uniref:sensor histidine kinase n=1 Tax=Ahrensia sp. 13_GOM-1096m TaxID=1380380 RepID=UPI000479E1A5|nr:sensor histidine kinase [Ahrensia sp. 13_GOM-1096m]